MKGNITVAQATVDNSSQRCSRCQVGHRRIMKTVKITGEEDEERLVFE